MIKVQDFIKYLKRNFGVKITKSAYSSYDGCYFFSPKADTGRLKFNSIPVGNDKKNS